MLERLAGSCGNGCYAAIAACRQAPRGRTLGHKRSLTDGSYGALALRLEGGYGIRVDSPLMIQETETPLRAQFGSFSQSRLLTRIYCRPSHRAAPRRRH